MPRFLLLYALLFFSPIHLSSCTDPTKSDPIPSADLIPEYTYRVVSAYPHDPQAFTQGLAIEDTVLYEGTGLNGSSSLRLVDLTTGTVRKLHPLSSTLFGEGITVYGNRIIQLTWQSNIGFIYDKTTLEELRSVSYPTEGWGITYDGTRFIMSDGSSTLFFRDRDTFEETGRVHVTDDKGPVSRLNELEYVKGEIFANVWQTNRIARINPANGKVTGWIDLSGLLVRSSQDPPVDVLNGIAYDPERDRLFVTGKLWPRLFEITLLPK